ncbi:MAG: ATP-binding protein [Phycisphaerae bacterium]|nr:ATP-binding protein [Phycisphaerae bacterium]
MTNTLRQAEGNYVVGERFWDRENDLALFAKRIDEGAHLLLVAQRRMGKTSLMREAARRLENRYICIFVDLQQSRSPADAMAELSVATRPHGTLWRKTKGAFANVLKNIAGVIDDVEVGEVRVRLRAGLNAGNWAAKGDELFGVLAASERPVLLLLDEVPILVNNILKGEDRRMTPERRARTDEFLSWLRRNSLEHQGHIRIVVSGSIGLEPILRQAKLSATINNFAPFELKPWDEDASIGCLEALANEYGVCFQEGAATEMVRRLGCCIPHHVQMFFSRVYARCFRTRKMDFSASEVEEVYRTEMLSIRGHAELTHYEERLEGVLGREVFPLALEMLTEAAVTGSLTREVILALQKDYAFEGQSVVDVQKEILWVLEHDGYLKPSPQGHVFVSPLVRDWWQARHGAFHTPRLARKES